MTDSLRVVTINFWGTEDPLDVRLALAERQLRALEADVVCMQEVRPLPGHPKAGRPLETTASLLAGRLDMSHIYEASLRWSDDAFFPGYPAGQEGLAVLSRLPIADHFATPLPQARATERRILLSAEIVTPSGHCWIHTTHLHYRLDDGLAREQQVTALDAIVRGIDSELPQIICGDFNATPDHDEIRFLRGLTTLDGRRTHYQDAWARIHPADVGITWSSENELTRPLRSLDIDRRIDYIFVTTRRKDGRGTVKDCRVVLEEREAGICASDHYGVLADVQLAAN